MNKDNIRHALSLLRDYVPSFDLYRLAGNVNKGLRQELLSALHDTKLPKSECGITRLQSDFMEAMNITEFTCNADRDSQFVEACKNAFELNSTPTSSQKD